MSELVKRYRDAQLDAPLSYKEAMNAMYDFKTYADMFADEIERLEKANIRLQEALAATPTDQSEMIERLEKENAELKAKLEGIEKTDNVHIRLSSSSREPWLCPRCGKVHGPNSYWCDCPPDFIKI